MTSETHTRYGSRVPRHGMGRRWCRYQVSSRRRTATRFAFPRAPRSSRDMLSPDDIRADFVRMMSKPEAAIDLARTALLVAAESDPNVDVDGELHTLESWAAELRARLDPGWNNLQKLARLRAFVFEELGFRGDRTDYYHPRNSLLHEVIKRRRGIPLTLAIVMMEVGWRI